MNQPVKAVTFDFWDTIVIDDSDEPKRAKRGLRSKPDERRHLLPIIAAIGAILALNYRLSNSQFRVSGYSVKLLALHPLLL